MLLILNEKIVLEKRNNLIDDIAKVNFYVETKRVYNKCLGNNDMINLNNDMKYFVILR